MLYSDNAEPIYMFRVRPMESIELPWIFRWLGPMQGDFFFGELAGNVKRSVGIAEKIATASETATGRRGRARVGVFAIESH